MAYYYRCHNNISVLLHVCLSAAHITYEYFQSCVFLSVFLKTRNRSHFPTFKYPISVIFSVKVQNVSIYRIAANTRSYNLNLNLYITMIVSNIWEEPRHTGTQREPEEDRITWWGGTTNRYGSALSTRAENWHDGPVLGEE